MKSFKSFKQWVFPNLFPAYYKDYDTYKDKNGKGILERFIEVCSNYLDTDIIPDIDNFMDILDVDVTPDIFLNYFWEYFDYIPYAYGVLVKGVPFTKENVASWLNTPDGFPKADTPDGFPKADTRSILKYAVSLYKIRCTQDFYTILGRFYGVRFELEEILFEDGYSNKPSNNPGINYRLIGAVFEDVVSTYSGENEYYGDWKGLYPYGDCTSCTTIKANIYIPKGMYDAIQDNIDNVKNAFVNLLNKYIPVNVKPFTKDTIELISEIPTIIPIEIEPQQN
jgi:hypothetical protein